MIAPTGVIAKVTMAVSAVNSDDTKPMAVPSPQMSVPTAKMAAPAAMMPTPTLKIVVTSARFSRAQAIDVVMMEESVDSAAEMVGASAAPIANVSILACAPRLEN